MDCLKELWRLFLDADFPDGGLAQSRATRLKDHEKPIFRQGRAVSRTSQESLPLSVCRSIPNNGKEMVKRDLLGKRKWQRMFFLARLFLMPENERKAAQVRSFSLVLRYQKRTTFCPTQSLFRVFPVTGKSTAGL